jgi:hypothetical protein
MGEFSTAPEILSLDLFDILWLGISRPVILDLTDFVFGHLLAVDGGYGEYYEVAGTWWLVCKYTHLQHSEYWDFLDSWKA